MRVISLAAMCVAAATSSNLTYFAEDCESENRAAIKVKIAFYPTFKLIIII